MPLTTLASDGLYQVQTRTICAGFVVEGGRVTCSAPVIRAMWRTGRLTLETITRIGD